MKPQQAACVTLLLGRGGLSAGQLAQPHRGLLMPRRVLLSWVCVGSCRSGGAVGFGVLVLGEKHRSSSVGWGQSPALIPRAWKGNERDLLPITFGHFLVFLPKSHGKFAVLRRAEAVEAACPRCPTGEELGALGFFGEALGKAAGHGWLGSSMDGGRAGRRIPPGAVLLSPVPSPSLRAPSAQLPRQEQGWPRGSRAGGPAGLGATAGAGLLAAPRSALRQ